MPHSGIIKRQGKGEDAADRSVSVELNEHVVEMVSDSEARMLHGDVSDDV